MNRTSAKSLSPMRVIGRGVGAGIVGTAAMDVVSFLQFRKGGGKQRFVDWESGADIETWADASAPGHVGQRVVEGFLQRKLPASRSRVTNNTVHWATGLAWGAAFGVLAGAKRRHPAWGALLGSTAWLTSYAVLPATGLYKPITEYDVPTLAKDLGTHLVYGLATSSAFGALA